MGDAALHTAAAQPEEARLAGYRIILHEAALLPRELRNLVMSQWLNTLRFGNDYFKLTDQHAYFGTYRRYLEALLSKPETKVLLAVLDDDRDVVLGFAVTRSSILDYVWVHRDQRKHGIARSLIPLGIDTITHVTHVGLTIWGSKYGTWKFNPFA